MKRQSAGQRARILFYSHTGLVSGAEHVLLNTLRHLDHARFDAVAVCPAEGDLPARIRDLGITTFPVNVLKARFTSSPRLLLSYLRSLFAVIASFRYIVATLAPDVIQANSVRAALVATFATVGTRTPVIWHVQDDLPSHPISTAIRLWAFCSRRSHLFFVSAATARAFAGALNFEGKSHILHNGVDPQSFSSSPSDRGDVTFRQELQIDPGSFLITAVGMINPRKDLVGLVRAFGLVHARHPSARLAIVGAPIFNRDASYLEQLRNLTRDLRLEPFVHFVGPRSDVSAVLRSTDLVVLNARAEPFGLVLVEAMLSETPVLATRVGGIPEIITDGLTGFLVEPGDPSALAARILHIIRDPEARSGVVSAASLSARTRFSVQRFSAEHDKLLSAILPGSLRSRAPETSSNDIKVALFHDNFAQSGGAERVAEELFHCCRKTFKHTRIFTTLSVRQRLPSTLRDVPIRTTWMQYLPGKAKLFRAFFLLYPFAVRSADLDEYDLIVTSCFGYAKGVRRSARALHVCFCHTPMRWVWRTEDYLAREKNSRLKRLLLRLPIRWLRQWELSAAANPDLYIANSAVVAARLFQAFGVHATVIPPPIETDRFTPAAPLLAENFYLVISRLVPYKRLDLVIAACTLSNRRLIVIGDGPARKRLQQAAGPSVTFLGRAPDHVVVDHAQRCRALLFPGEEDFGITPLEVNAAGRPVVAFRGGGATETILDGVTGVFFDQPTAASLMQAMDRLESLSWQTQEIQRHARKYDVAIFHQRITAFLQAALQERTNGLQPIPGLVTA